MTQHEDPDAIELADSFARHMVARWIRIERDEYANKKYQPGKAEYAARLRDIQENGLNPNSTEMVFLLNYLKRAELLGVETLAGRQAFGKFVVTATAMFERIFLAFGMLPTPGVPSGEVTPWKKPDDETP
jgi:hypothetical protein